MQKDLKSDPNGYMETIQKTQHLQKNGHHREIQEMKHGEYGSSSLSERIRQAIYHLNKN
jgi:hypothetical protein